MSKDYAIDCKLPARFKMEALAPVEHSRVKYVPGDTFYVESVETRDYLQKANVAKAKSDPTADVPPTTTDAAAAPADPITPPSKGKLWNRTPARKVT